MARNLFVFIYKFQMKKLMGTLCINIVLPRRRFSFLSINNEVLIDTFHSMHSQFRISLLRILHRNFTRIIQAELQQNLTANEMKLFLSANNISVDQGYTCFSFPCIFCPLTRKQSEKIGKIHINKVTGMFLCPDCRISGTWQELQNYITILRQHRKLEKKQLISKPAPNWDLTTDETLTIQSLIQNTVPLETLEGLELETQTTKFGINKFLPHIIKKYGFRISVDYKQLMLPIYGLNGIIVGFRTWKISDSSDIKETIVPKKAAVMMFGWQKITNNQREVVLTKFPLDVIAIAQELNLHALSLPKGLSILPVELLPLFEQFRKITLWFGNDVESWEAARLFARKLGEQRCFFVKPKEQNPCPYEALQASLNLQSIFKDAYSIGHKSIISFTNLRENVLTELAHTEEVAGIKWQRYPVLNKLLKGHRRGELTILTGATGSGKTTFMSDYSLDLCIQGVNTLWGSFEINNVRLARMMLIQFAQVPLEKQLENYDFWADQFEQLPLYFMTFHGEEKLKNVLDVMSHAVYVYDIRHVVVDNLQFMMGIPTYSTRFDRFYYQDAVLAAFRKFATVNNVHVSLVIHPRKEQDGEELSITSIFGSAKASQEADNILILQNRIQDFKGRKYIQVSKNRYDGDIGIVPLEFNKETLSFGIKKKSPKKSNLKISNEEINT